MDFCLAEQDPGNFKAGINLCHKGIAGRTQVKPKTEKMSSSFAIDLEKTSRTANIGIVVLTALFALAGNFISFYFHFLTVAFLLLVLLNVYWRHFQSSHTLLANFGFMAQFRYMAESVGPEFRQYLFPSDTEEGPFNRVARSEVYRKAKGFDSSSAFGTLLDNVPSETKPRHSFYPVDKVNLDEFDVAVGAARGLETTYHIRRPIMISAMSYGALGENAVRALARGARKAGIPMNTGEGGYPKCHLRETVI